MSAAPPIPVIVMAKAPQPGRVKTRLIPALGAEGAAYLAARLLDHTLDQAAAAGIGPVELCCAPDAAHPAFRRHRHRPGIRFSEQGEGDLGERMHRALARALANAPGALLIGTDAPALDAQRLQAAAASLTQADAVFVPALDGGYALVGLRQPAPSLFGGMAWSVPTVMADTRSRLATAGLRHIELPAVADIDKPDDLHHLAALGMAWADLHRSLEGKTC